MARKFAFLALLALLALPLSGCYQMGYYTGKAVHTILPTPPADNY
jgi:hypothetical protein